MKRSTRKAIALLCVLAFMMMIFSPVAIAGSDNSVDRVVTVTKDYDLDDLDKDRIPFLTIENDDDDWTADETFRLQLSADASWNDAIIDNPYATVAKNVYNDRIAIDHATPGAVTVTKITDQIIEIRGTNLDEEDLKLHIPMNVELDGASGEQKVTVDPRDSALSASTHTFAIAAPGETVATVGTKETIRRTASTGAAIVLDETVAGALKAGEQEFRMRLPRGFEWCEGTTVDIGAMYTTPSGIALLDEYDDRDITVSFEVTTASSIRQSIVITPVVKATKDASYGDVTVSITNRKGEVTSVSNLLIGEYKDYGVEVDIEEVEEFYAGWWDDDYTTATITLEETISGSFLQDRVIEFTLPDWVMVREDFDIEPDVGPNETIGAKAGEDEKKNVNSFEYTVTGDEEEIELEIPITISGTAAVDGDRDIVLNIKGGGVEETDLVIGKAIAPVTVEVGEQEEVFEAGLQYQDAPEITITEADAGAIRDFSDGNRPDCGPDHANELVVFVRDAFADSVRFDSFDWEVVEGDIDIDKAEIVGDEAIVFTVKAESEEASTIRIYNIEMTLDRTVPRGTFRLDIGGSAVVDNWDYDDGDFPGRVERFDYVEVGTPIPGVIERTAVFTVDSAIYTVDGVEKTMDVAPYIKDGRTFMPVRFVADALGVSPGNILWDQDTFTVTILKGDRIAQMVIGSDILVVNGVQIRMDVETELRDGRTMLPIRWVGQALGAEITWDPVARTVTVEK